MNFNKLTFAIIAISLLSGCAQNVALLGPAITIGTTGNAMQAGIQYGTNQAIKQETGKDAFTYISEAVEEDHRKKKFNKKFTKLIEERINETRKKLNISNQ